MNKQIIHKTVHKTAGQKSTTLSRRHVAAPSHAKRRLASRPDITRDTSVPISVHVNKFAPSTPSVPPQPTKRDRPAEPHPAVVRAQACAAQQPHQTTRTVTRRSPATSHHHSTRIIKPNHLPSKQHTATLAPKPAAVLKNEAITEALQRATTPEKAPRRSKKPKNRIGRWLQIASVGLAIMLIGGYFTYLGMPNISTRIAAIQSGVNAKYPGYRPTGYALSGPITFKSGEVRMKFAYADGGQSYTITQQKSSLNSAALKETLTADGGDVQTTTAGGLTIYSTDRTASWINGGVLYQITLGGALSSEQVTKIATSL
ncbi:DUF4367 domain-containing protein [Candidatus Saccharibacteria bacterium oral taxon 488]|nr:DUF4367 domain-containing protein [Candidatus Saccharibacteria bacterium oral taxon 488]